MVAVAATSMDISAAHCMASHGRLRGGHVDQRPPVGRAHSASCFHGFKQWALADYVLSAAGLWPHVCCAG